MSTATSMATAMRTPAMSTPAMSTATSMATAMRTPAIEHAGHEHGHGHPPQEPDPKVTGPEDTRRDRMNDTPVSLRPPGLSSGSRRPFRSARSLFHGLEWAVEAGDVVTAQPARLARRHLRHGAGWSDARPVRGRPIAPRPPGTTPRCAASPSSRWPRALAGAPARDDGAGDGFRRGGARRLARAALIGSRPAEGAVAYPVAVGTRRPAHGIALDRPARLSRGLAANLVSAACARRRSARRDGQRILAALEPLRRATARARRRTYARRSRRRGAPLRHRRPCVTKPNIRGCSAHDHIHARTPARRRRRPGRLRQDGADGRAVQAPPRPLRHRRHHQRHLHQGGRRVPDALRRAGARAHHGRRDRRLPAHRDPRGRLDQPRRGRRHEPALPRRSTSS